MKRSTVFLTVALCLTLAGVAQGGLPRTFHRKVLPLDKLPGALLKTREKSEYMPDRIIVKLHSAPPVPGGGSTFGVPQVDKFIQRYNARSIEQLFPPPQRALAAQSKVDEGIANIYVVKLSGPIDPFQAAEDIGALPEVDYAEPWFIYQVDGVASTPNDSLYSGQWGFAKVKADSAWNISQGDTSVVIGIVDTGIQWDHPDLNANIFINYGEYGPDGLGGDKSTNGIDDDGDGFIDDWHGADLAGGDWVNPTYDNNTRPVGANTAHGTHVAGIAGAVTNNVHGVAGMGYKCKILPVKTSADNDTRGAGGTAYIIMGFEGIKYAVDMGAKIINTSWGGGGASQFEQDVIDYAVAHGAVVVAAAGNSNSSDPHYPAAYDGVFSVAATMTTDSRANYSNFGTTIDVSAPGGADGGSQTLWILSTYFPNNYAYMSGTSMASPLAAGVCALVKSANPSFTGVQAAEQVRVSCDNINAQNPLYIDYLGKGRVNALRALTLVSPSLRMTSFATSDSVGGNNNGALEPGETFTLAINVKNYLQPTTGSASITLTSSDTTVQVLSGTFPVGSVAMNGSADNSLAPYQVHVKNNIPPSHLAVFKLVISDGSYNDFQVFTVLLNPTFANHDVNNVTTTLTNIGRIGYLDISNAFGDGFIYNGVNELFEGGLLIGYSSTKIVDNIRNPSGVTSQDADFTANQIYDMHKPGTYAAQEGNTIYTDAGAPVANLIGLKVNQYSYAYTTPGDSDYVIIRYDIQNTTAGSLSNVYAGIFIDWDMQPNINNNKAIFDPGRSLGYCWDTTQSTPIYCGLRALDSATGYRGLEVTSADISRSGKFSWISSGVITPLITGDIHMVLSSGPYTLAPSQKKIVAFAMVAGSNLAGLRNHADAAKAKWDNLRPLVGVQEGRPALPGTFALMQNYPNPFNPSTSIGYEVPSNSKVTLSVYDVLGRLVSTLVDKVQDAGRYTVTFDANNLASGIYFYRFEAVESRGASPNRFSEVKKLILLR